MTTTVKITACCNNKTEVVVESSDRKVVLQDGQELTVYVYDNQRVVVREQPKQ